MVWDPKSSLLSAIITLFQSLFSWKMVWDPRTIFKYTASFGVSILVFLEDGLRHDISNSTKIYILGFNPCFLGRWFETWYSSIFDLSIFVSILVFLEDGLRHLKKVFAPHYPFVSILVFLEDGLRQLPSTGSLDDIASFNPCFLGRWFETPYLQSIFIFHKLFQSLFSWKMVWDIIDNHLIIYI